MNPIVPAASALVLAWLTVWLYRKRKPSKRLKKLIEAEKARRREGAKGVGA